MVPQFQKPQIMEIHVRMDCNGCVQKIKKALCGISGIYDLYIDFPQQKITIVGWADPEKIVKAIKKTRKTATICNIEPIESPPPQQQPEPSSSSSFQPTEQENEGNAKAPEEADETTEPHPTEEAAPPAAQASLAENPPKDTPSQPRHAQPAQSWTQAENNASYQQPPTSTARTRDVEEIHLIHHHHHPPPNYGIGNRYGYGYGQSYVFHQQEPYQPIHVTHSYNAYRPSPYVTEYEYVRSPPPPRFYTHYSNNNRMEYYSEDYYYHHNGSNSNGHGNITSMFSDENPNACRIV